MTTANTGGDGTSTPAPETITLPLVPPTPPAAKADAEDANISMPKTAFNARLKQAEEKWAKELGVDLETAKAAIATAKAAEESKKTDAEKAATAKADLEQAQADLKATKGMLAETAKATLDALTEEQKATVLELAGDDPAKQIKTANTLKKSWDAAPVVTTTPPAVSTMPTQGAPKDNGNTGSAPDPQAIFIELMKVNPFAGALYGDAQGLFTKRA